MNDLLLRCHLTGALVSKDEARVLHMGNASALLVGLRERLARLEQLVEILRQSERGETIDCRGGRCSTTQPRIVSLATAERLRLEWDCAALFIPYRDWEARKKRHNDERRARWESRRQTKGRTGS